MLRSFIRAIGVGALGLVACGFVGGFVDLQWTTSAIAQSAERSRGDASVSGVAVRGGGAALIVDIVAKGATVPVATSRPTRSEISVVEAADVKIPVANSRSTKINWSFQAAPPSQRLPAAGRSAASYDDELETREALARDIQKELTRVKCYWGFVDGRWGYKTRQAMNAFVRNRNASLPTSKPDLVLLSLLQGYRGGRCGETCADKTCRRTSVRR